MCQIKYMYEHVFIMLWIFYCWSTMNKATLACFDFLLSLNSDCTYFNKYIFCIITDLTNKKNCPVIISSNVILVHSYTCYAWLLCLQHPFFYYWFKGRNYSSLSDESSINFWNHFLSQRGQNIKDKLLVKKGSIAPENDVYAPLREQCVTLEHLFVNLH